MKKTIEVHTIENSFDSLVGLPRERFAAFAGVCHAVNELNVLKRVFIFSGHSEPPNNPFAIALWIQNFTILRIWSAKIFELQEFLQFSGKYNKTKDKLLREIAVAAQDSFKDLKSEPGFEMTKRFRHQITNHLSLKAIKNNIGFLGDKIDCSMCIPPGDGNSFFPLGEEVVFGGGLAAIWNELKVNPDDSLDDWVDWNRNANRWATEQHLLLYERIIRPLGGKTRTTEVELPNQLVGSLGSVSVPVYVERNSTSDG